MRTTDSGQSIVLLFEALELLSAEKIDYAVIGAMAGSIHGTVRASLDADIVLSITVRALGSLERKFGAAGFSTMFRQGDFDDPIPALLELSDKYSNRVDLLGGIRGMDPAAFTRTVMVPFDGKTLKVMGREDFIASKVFAGGPLDLSDAISAIAVAEQLDIDLLRRVTRRYGNDALKSLEEILAKP